MKNRPDSSSPVRLTRREAGSRILAAMGGAFLYACSGTPITNAGTDGGSTNADGGTGGTDSGGSSDTWASGGTESMTGTYPDPFPSAAAACVLIATATEGPCTEAADQVRQDISEGYIGLPVRLAFRVVDASCKPIEGAKVKVWHTQVTGSYSGNTPNNGMCLKDSTDSAKHYFRGVQTTDAAGRVDFDTCFPGWYRGRAIHIHFTVSLDGKAYTSQVGFDQAVINDVFATHPEYKGFGAPDTSNSSDNILGGGGLAAHMLETSRMADGAMMATKTLVVNV